MSEGDGGGQDVVAQQEASQQRARERRNAAIKEINDYFNGVGKTTRTVDTTNQWQTVVDPKTGKPVLNPRTGEPVRTPFTINVKTTTTPGWDRNKVYDTISRNVADYQMQDLNDQRKVNARQLKFQLARTGNLKSSTQVDQTGELNRLYRKGALQAANLGKSAADQARTNDEGARLNAISQVNADVDAAQALKAAQASIAANSNNATNFGKGQALGDVFSRFAYLYQQNQQGQALKRAYNDFGSGFGPSSAGGAKNYNGSVMP